MDRERDTRCSMCGGHFHHLGIASHRAACRKKNSQCFYCRKLTPPKLLQKVWSQGKDGNPAFYVELCGRCFGTKRLEAINTAQNEHGYNSEVKEKP